MPSVTSTEHNKLSPAAPCLGELYSERNCVFMGVFRALCASFKSLEKGSYFTSLWRSVRPVADRLT